VDLFTPGIPEMGCSIPNVELALRFRQGLIEMRSMCVGWRVPAAAHDDRRMHPASGDWPMNRDNWTLRKRKTFN
jgi:hypothetical protein